MIFGKLSLYVALAFASLGSAQLASVVTKCTVPNTVALTFVSLMVSHVHLIRYFSHACRTTAHTSTCTFPSYSTLTRHLTLNIRYDISKALIAAGAKGTFFFNGNNCMFFSFPSFHCHIHTASCLDACIYDADEIKRVKYAYSKGHQVASHTWSHSDLTTLTWDESTFIYAYCH